MAFRFGDPGGRVYGALGTANANFLSYWTVLGTIQAGTFSVSAGNGRSTGSCLRYVYPSGPNWYISMYKFLDSQATLGVAFAIKINTLGIGQISSLVSFHDSVSLQCDLRLNLDGSLSITRNGTTLGTTAGVLAANAWTHIEFKVLFHPSAGTAQLWLNSVSALNLSAQNTRATANSSANSVRVGLNTNQVGYSAIGAFTVDFDDIVIYDGQATDANGLTDITGPIGDCGLAWLPPNGAGTNTQFTPDSGSNYARLSDATPDGDTSYVESSTIGNIDTYNLTDLPAGTSTIKSMALVHYARKTDVGSRGIKAELRTSATEYTYANETNLSDTYQYYLSPWGSNPATGVAWTPSDINGLEAGQKVTS